MMFVRTHDFNIVMITSWSNEMKNFIFKRRKVPTINLFVENNFFLRSFRFGETLQEMSKVHKCRIAKIFFARKNGDSNATIVEKFRCVDGKWKFRYFAQVQLTFRLKISVVVRRRWIRRENLKGKCSKSFPSNEERRKFSFTSLNEPEILISTIGFSFK